jgi:feruloyl-CoA synthase
VRAEVPLDTSYARRMTDRLVHWASTDPDRVFIARRERLADGSTGDWRKITYGEALAAARSIGQACWSAACRRTGRSRS